MKSQPVVRDERTISVENASYRLAHTVVGFGLLVDVIYRSYILREDSWDLFLLIFLGAIVATVYQASHRTLSRDWAYLSTAIAVLAAIVAALFVIAISASSH